MTTARPLAAFAAALAACALLALAGCSALPAPVDGAPPKETPPSQSDGKFYLDDGPPPAGSQQTPLAADATPKWEPIPPKRNRPYTALGKRYVPMTRLQAYKTRGFASWYGKRYHGRETALGERYDMHKMTAAHPTLPIPSYARVTRLSNGKSVVVRVNDRGPFLGGRIIDLSYAAARKLGYTKQGTAEVEVELILPADMPAATTADSLLTGVIVPAAVAPPPKTVTVTVLSPPPVATKQPQEETQKAPTAAAAKAKAEATKEATNVKFIQLGSFESPENAANYLQKMKAILPPNLANKLKIYDTGDGMLRVQLRPYANRKDAAVDDKILCQQYQLCGFMP